jgi:alcohol dehydrogenase (cytochrome c)/quinohemoprotein ethanol dehydrogenase
VLVYNRDATGTLPEVAETPLVFNPPAATGTEASVALGRDAYHRNCGTCHGDTAISGGLVTDLRASALLHGDGWFDVVLGGALESSGMVSFAPELSREQVSAVRDYVIARAHESKAYEEQAANQ